jgi:signal transduction histidine kinase/ligand-binding sensor domain-containing protein
MSKELFARWAADSGAVKGPMLVRPPAPSAPRGRGMYCLLLAAASAIGLVAASSGSGAPFAGYQHKSWTAVDGAPLDISTLAQTPDGYLWLGTGSGIYRFDGVRFERVVPRDGTLPHSDVTALLPMSNGDLLIGYRKGGVSRLSKGRLTNYQGFPSSKVIRIVERADGTVWVHSEIELSRGGLRRLSGGRWANVTAGLPADSVIATMVLDPRQALWVVTAGSFYRLASGERDFRKLDIDPFPKSLHKTGSHGSYVGGLPLALDGSLWFVDDDAFAPIAPPAPGSRLPLHQAARAFFSRNGDFWISARDTGVQRVTRALQSGAARTRANRPEEIFGPLDGLTSTSLGAILEDREGDIWIGTNNGLDRFKAADVRSEPSVKMLSRELAAFAPAPEGALYILNSAQLQLLKPSGGLQVLSYFGKFFQGGSPICPSPGQSVWIGSDTDLRRWTGPSSRRIDLPAGVTPAALRSCREDSTGRLWLAVAGKGLYRLDPGGWRASSALPPFDDRAMLAEDRNGVVWAYADSGPLRRIDGADARSFDGRQGLVVGDVAVLHQGQNGLLVGGAFGLAEFDGTRFRSLQAGPDSPFARISGIVQTTSGETWLNTGTGIVRLSTADLEAGFRTGRWPARYRLFDREDGLSGLALQDSYAETAHEGTDGRLWFMTNQGISWIDPRRLLKNTVAPSLVIQKVIADGRVYTDLDDLTLPAGTSNVEVDYTATSLRTPEKVAFRYRIEGVDREWVNPGRRRQAFYTRLGPGTFNFQVIAANESGLWNRDGAMLQFRIRPTFTQTWQFRLACAVLALLGLAGMVLLYVRRIAARLRERLDERLRERERIARELHDTLLQGFQGLQLHFQSVVETLPKDSPTRSMLERALFMTDAALVDARGRVRELRAAGTPTDLPQHLKARGESLLGPTTPTLKIVEDGRPRELDHTVEREVAAVAEEAIFNAIKHARATQIEVRIGYSWRRLEVTISDDGRGFDPAILAGLAGKHFGMLGMRERVRRLRGTFSVGNGPQGGTEVRMTVPGPVAYGALGWLLDRALKV